MFSGWGTYQRSTPSQKRTTAILVLNKEVFTKIEDGWVIELVIILFYGGEFPGKTADINHFYLACGCNEYVFGPDISKFPFLFLKFFSSQKQLVHDQHELRLLIKVLILFPVLYLWRKEIAYVFIGDLTISKVLLILGCQCHSNSSPLLSPPSAVRSLQAQKGNPCSFRGGDLPFPSTLHIRPNSW